MFADRLKLLRNEKKLTQAQFAKLIKVAPSTVGMYELGSREPNINNIKAIANFFDVSSDYLIGLTDIRETSPSLLKSNKKDLSIDSLPTEAKKEIDMFLNYIEYKYTISKDKSHS